MRMLIGMYHNTNFKKARLQNLRPISTLSYLGQIIHGCTAFGTVSCQQQLKNNLQHTLNN